METVPLRILIVEDSEDDMLLVIHELRRAGYDPVFERVETAEAMAAALEKGEWDLVIADYVLPSFSGLDALRILQKTGYDLPFIIVSGTIGEETAVEAMKAGAHDYIMKNNLKRLIPAVERELKEAKIRRERGDVEQRLRTSENLYRTIFETTGNATVIIEEDTMVSLMNREAEKLTGYSKEEVEGKKSWSEIIVSEDLDRLKEYHRLRRVNPDAVPSTYETALTDKQGKLKNVMVMAAMIPGTTKSVASLLDITGHKRMEGELKKRIKELEEFYNVAIGRELRMKELKEEMESIKEELERCRAGERL
jgi:sigma-B regulation protein RsbU (phosphoserine phosphatase)